VCASSECDYSGGVSGENEGEGHGSTCMCGTPYMYTATSTVQT